MTPAGPAVCGTSPGSSEESVEEVAIIHAVVLFNQNHHGVVETNTVKVLTRPETPGEVEMLKCRICSLKDPSAAISRLSAEQADGCHPNLHPAARIHWYRGPNRFSL